MKYLLTLLFLLVSVHIVWAVPCTLLFDYPVSEPVDSFRVYQGATVATLVPTISVPVPTPRTETISTPLDCIVGNFIAATTVRTGFLESPKSIAIQVGQALSPSNLHISVTITMP